MDKYIRREFGYRTDYPDGIYEVVNIIYWDEPIEIKHKNSRIVKIVNGMVICPLIPEVLDKIIPLTQLYFFEVNEVLDCLPPF